MDMTMLKRCTAVLPQSLILIGSACIILMMLHISADVISRNLLGTPLVATNEIVSRYYMVGLAFLPLAYVEMKGEMINVGVINGLLGKRSRILSDALICLISLVIYGLLVWASWHHAVKAHDKGAFIVTAGTRVATWPAYFFLPMGFFLAAIAHLARFLTQLGGPAPETAGPHGVQL
jgi:TRAP-type C4-dicarboxylate transport system permease small subunit